jgi:hypothetical protein
MILVPFLHCDMVARENAAFNSAPTEPPNRFSPAFWRL